MVWKEWIKRVGIKTIADKLGVTYEVVRLWANTSQNPSDKHKRLLVQMCEGEFGYSDFFKGER